jgi:hypothetical protein
MRRLWPWVLVAGCVVVVAFGAAVSADSVSVVLGGGFVAVQLVAPVLVVRRRTAAPVPAIARPEPTTGRARVRWVRLDVKPGGPKQVLTCGVPVITMALAPSARRTP